MTATPFDSLTITFEVSWSTAPFAAASYTDESANVRSFSIRRGRTSEFDQFTAGSMTVELENSNRRYDPLYASSPLNPNLLPRKRCRMSATYNSVTYRLFTGFLDGLPQSGEQSNHLGTATLTASDGFKMFARARQPTGNALVGDNESVSARIGRLLDYVGWPAGDRDIDTDSPALVHMQEEGDPLLNELYSAADGDLGQFFIAGDGKATYHGHRWQLGHNLTASAVLGESIASSEIPYTDCVFTYDDTLIFNRATVSMFTGNEAVGYTAHTVDVNDATSVTAYGESTKALGTVGVNNLNVAQNTCEWVLAYYKDPKLRCTQVAFNPRGGGAYPNSTYPVVLGAEVGTRWTFNRRPQNVGSAISQDVVVEGISYQMTVDSFTATFDLAQAPVAPGGGNYWIIGTSKLGSSGTAVWA